MRPRKQWRKIVVGGKTYRYLVGKTTTVIRDNLTNRVVSKVGNHELVGMTPEDHHSAKICGFEEWYPTPGNIAEHIQGLQ